MKNFFYKASFTVETTYLSVFIFFSIIFLIYLTLSMYNVSIMTSKAYYILEEHVADDSNEELGSVLYEKACGIAKYSGALIQSVETKVKTEFENISIDYVFEMNIPVFETSSSVFQDKAWQYEIHTNSNRERIQEAMFLMKIVKDGLDWSTSSEAEDGSCQKKGEVMIYE